jgi:two-component system CheB/CheR fusion protein
MVSDGSKLLIVDDSDIVRESVRHLAHALGYIPVAVSSGPEALQKLSEGGFSVVLLDYSLNGMDGATAAGIAREAHPSIRIIGMSAHGDVASSAFRDAGVSEMLHKPFDLSDLEKMRL